MPEFTAQFSDLTLCQARLDESICLLGELSIHLLPGWSYISTFSLGQTLLIPALEVPLVFADPHSTSDPPFLICLSPLICKLVDSRPVCCMIILEVDFPTVCVHQMGWWDVLSKVFVKFQLLTSEGIDKRCYELEETPYRPGNYTYGLESYWARNQA